jgi:putative ABC transport system ATP-binding protein/lipoprotein-releasing system ATP-binding protein
MSMGLIELKDIKKVYTLDEATIVAVEEVSLSIEKGQFISIVGHSGSGKTTLLSIMGGILSPSHGVMYFDGTDVYGLNEDGLSDYRAGRIGYVFQFASLLPVLTAKENLLLPTIFKNGKAAGQEKRAIEYLDMVGLADKANAYPGQLSGGQQRRIAIARSLMNEPEAILADEPTGDLDEETEAEVMEFFKKVNREQGITFVLVTHSSELARDADRMIRMTHGHVEELP